MEAAELLHVVRTEGEEGDGKKQVQNVLRNSHVDDALLDAELHSSVYEKSVSFMDTNKNQVANTPVSTPYSPTTVYLTGMPIRYCTETVIEKMMSRYGKIARCTVHTQQSNKIFAFCDFVEPSSATEAIRALNGRKLGGKYLLVRPAYKESSSVPSSVASNENLGNPKRQRQQLDSKIDAIKRKLAKYSSKDS